jgi:hypothetical protein
MISDSGHEVDALGHAGDEGRIRPRKSAVSCQISFDPHVSEWGNPLEVTFQYPAVSEVAAGGIRRELKHLSTSRKRNQARDSLSSGERNGNSLNLGKQFPRGCGTPMWDLIF